MSLKLARLRAADKRKNIRRTEMLALMPDLEYNDGRTKQCHKDECDINKIMSRFEVTGTISHVNKYEAVYGDFSDFDFHEQTRRLTQGREVFDALPSEVRQEFGQSPAAFFDFVNDPANKDDLLDKLPALAKPGTQLPREVSPTADREAAVAAVSEPASENIDEPPAEPDKASAAS